jgi:hypothetical protein
MTGLRVKRQRAVERGDVEESTATGDPAEGPWSQLEMLIALLVDEMRSMQHMYLMSHSPKGTRHSPPDRIRRPGLRKRQPKLTMQQRMMLDPRMRRQAATDLASRRVDQARQRMERRARGDDG